MKQITSPIACAIIVSCILISGCDSLTLQETTDSTSETPELLPPETNPQDTQVNLVSNGNFEDGLTNWTQIEPAFESSDSYEGLGAVKLEGSGSVSQFLNITPNTRYSVSAWVEGTATVGVDVNGELSVVDGTGSEYAQVTFEFDSTDATIVQLFASANEDTSRVDNIEVFEVGESPLETADNLVSNGTFENGLSGWVQLEPASESGDTYEGIGAVKLEHDGSVTQTLSLVPNTRYVFSAWVEGTATVGVIVNDETISLSGADENYAPITFEFESGAATTATVFATANGDTTRVDNIAVYPVETTLEVPLVNLVSNGTFENGLSGWEQLEPAFESGDTHEGLGAVKLEQEGSVTQTLSIAPNNSYSVSAWIEGTATVGVTANGETFSVSGTDSNYAPVAFEFESGDAVTAELFAYANGEASRVDNIEVYGVAGEQQNPQESTHGNAMVTVTASDFQDPNLPGNVTDGSPDTRWSAQGRTGVWLNVDLGETTAFNALGIDFPNGDYRNYCFSIQTSDDGTTWVTQRSSIVSNGESLFSIPDTSARYVRYVGSGSSENEWNSITELQVLSLPITGDENISNGNGDCPAPTPVGEPIEETFNNTFNPGNPDSDKTPTENFDLTYWKITYPDASEAYPPAVVINEFYTDTDTGAMVFECINQGERTSNSTKYSRTELREMLRGPDSNIGTTDLGNNWVTSMASNTKQLAAGGVDGTMKATVAVDHVSMTYSDGNDYMLGRVVVGQIHGSVNEPFKLYYRKLPGNTRGSVYFSYEDATGEAYIDMFGSRHTAAADPEDGIALGEKWAYEVNVSGRDMVVTVIKEDGTARIKRLSWSDEYDDDWFYFKAGNYNQNNGGDVGDHAVVSIFSLDVSHN